MDNCVETQWFKQWVPMADGTRLYNYGVLPKAGVKCATIIAHNCVFAAESELVLLSLPKGN